LYGQTSYSIARYSPHISVALRDDDSTTKTVVPALAYGGGTNFTFSVIKGWTFQTGVGYAKFGENLRLNIPPKVTQTWERLYPDGYEQIIVDSFRVVQNGNEVWEKVYKWIPNNDSILHVDTIVGSNQRFKNSYHYLEVPWLLGYVFLKKKKKASIAFQAGMIAGFFLNANGKTFLRAQRDSITDLNGSLPFIKTSLSFHSSIFLQYNVSDYWSVFAEPYFRTNLRSIYRNEYPVSQRFNALGVNWGLRYYFDNRRMKWHLDYM